MQATVQELEVWYIIPSIRKQLAEVMKKKGLTQTKIAGILGITEAAVSQYLKSKRAAKVIFSETMKKEIEKSAEKLMAKKSQRSEVQRLVKLAEKNLSVCGVCKEHVEGCHMCFR
ncbi:MAG: helix-turn-helix domain-containing protein [Nanoarchaeota archaeon]